MRLALPQLNTQSVRFRTTAGAAIAFIVLLAATGLAINWFVGRQIDQSFDETLLEQAADRVALVDEGAALESLITPVGYEEIVAAIDTTGRVVASEGLTIPQAIVDLPTGVSSVSVVFEESGEGLEEEELRVAVAESSSGLRIVVGNEGENARRSKTGVRTMLLTIIPLTALAGAAVAWFVTGRALGPVKLMRNELDDVVSASSGSRVTEPGTRDEIAELGSTINTVLDRLDVQSLAQRRFVADASHELKSPLANARAIIDTSGVPAAGQHERDDYQRVTSSVGRELQRLQALVDDLLYLARGDEGAPRDPRPIDLADLIFDESERVAATSTKHIDAGGVVPVSVVVDPAEASRAIRNLLENAERFAEERVTVSVEESGSMVSMVVADDGPGIAKQDRATVFERFARIDTDRTRAAGGTGLGLSIVKSIAERNGGKVSLTEARRGGAQFVLSFPLAPGSPPNEPLL